MLSARMGLPSTGATAQLTLTDFNRLRWTVAALRLNPGLAQRLLQRAEAPAQVLDSTGLLRSGDEPARGAWIVLWDGINSLVELQQARPALRARPDLRFLYVGSFADVAGGFPADSEPLFPARDWSTAVALRVPLWVAAMSVLRASARPLKNARSAPALHVRLQAGACLVFCGLVRPSAAVLDGFVRGTGLQPLRQALQPLAGLDWAADAAATRSLVARAFDAAAAAARPTAPAADCAALYAVVNVLHRLASLCSVQARSPALEVNEYGVHPFFDPHDARAYRRNLFIDFGSTRGNDLLYPRSLDLLLQRKPCMPLRFLRADSSLLRFLADTDGSAFLALCDAHAQALLQALPRACAAGAER